MSVLIKGLKMPETEYVDVRIFQDGTAAIATGTKPYYRELKAEPVRYRLEKSEAGMTVAEYRERLIQAFHNADCDNLISIVVLPTEKEFQFLEWLLKKEYVPFLEKAKRHGKWKQTEVVHECFDIQGFKTWGIKCTCDRCGFKTIAIEGHFAQYKYCPNCGARMDKE